MMEMVDAFGHAIFESIRITLVCDDCLKTDHPEKCRHKLASMPRWLSSKKVETVRALLAEDPVRVFCKPCAKHGPETSAHALPRAGHAAARIVGYIGRWI
jgi:hypothetical protein